MYMSKKRSLLLRPLSELSFLKKNWDKLIERYNSGLDYGDSKYPLLFNTYTVQGNTYIHVCILETHFGQFPRVLCVFLSALLHYILRSLSDIYFFVFLFPFLILSLCIFLIFSAPGVNAENLV